MGWLAGGAGSDILIGSAANDVLMGGDNADLLIGGAGDDDIAGDTGWVAQVLDWAVTDKPDGTRLFYGAENGTPPATGAADVIYAGEGNDHAWGEFGNDVLFGEGGADRLYGGEGNDILAGGVGDDVLDGGAGTDIYLYNKGDGYDYILEAAGSVNTLRFGAGIGSGDIILRLGSLMLDLGNGDEIHIGDFDRNDAFNSSSIGSFEFDDGTILTTAELLARGFDLDGTAGDDNITGTNTTDRINGLGGNDTLTGDEGSDTLNGGAGADAMGGGAGDDTYEVDDEFDVVAENASGGNDTVRSSVSFSLGDNIENLILTGAGNTTGTGNALDNTLTGNGAANTLDGGAGADTLTGGAGDDIYVVDNAADTVIENSGEGADTVQSSVAYALGANLENLTLTGTASIAATGNELNNTLTGNGAANTLDGGAGDDTLDGGAGDDALTGGEGADTFVMNFGMGADTAADAQGGAIRLGANLDVADLLAARQGDDLRLRINGADDGLLLQGYYTSPQASWVIQDVGATINSRPRTTIRRVTPSLTRSALPLAA